MDINRVQAQALIFIESHLQEHKYPPTVRDIGKAAGYSSSSSAQKIVDALKRNDYINIDQASHKSICRGIRISKKGQEFLAIIKSSMIEA